MSPHDHNEALDVFLASHAETGEPSDEAFARVHQEVLALSATARRPLVRLPIPSEWYAAAALILVLLGVSLAMKHPSASADMPRVLQPKNESGHNEATEQRTAIDADFELAQGRSAMKSRDYRTAVRRLERCVQANPTRAECFKWLGSTYAKLAATEDVITQAEMQNKARASYRRFLELAPDDPSAEKVRMILESDKERSPP